MEPTRDVETRWDEPSKTDEFVHMRLLAERIDHYEKNLAVLETKLRPVLSNQIGYAVEVAHPEEEPEHDFAAQIKRLDNANENLEHLLRRIRL